MNDTSMRILRIFIDRRSSINGLMDGTALNEHLSVPLVEKYVARLEFDGLIAPEKKTTNGQRMWAATDKGRAAAREVVITSSRTFGNSSTTGTYRTPAWHTRSGSDAFLRVKSRGIDA